MQSLNLIPQNQKNPAMTELVLCICMIFWIPLKKLTDIMIIQLERVQITHPPPPSLPPSPCLLFRRGILHRPTSHIYAFCFSLLCSIACHPSGSPRGLRQLGYAQYTLCKQAAIFFLPIYTILQYVTKKYSLKNSNQPMD